MSGGVRVFKSRSRISYRRYASSAFRPCCSMRCFDSRSSKRTAQGTAPVFVPERIERIRTAMHLRDDRIHAATGTNVLLVAANPTVDGEMLTGRWVQALDADGQTLALLEFGVGRRVDAQVLRDVTARPSIARRSTAVRVMV
jgi:hypothetical protein